MATGDQQLSAEEFHRVQLQLLELRTENYKLKDENKKLKRDYTQSHENEVKLEKEVSKQVKLRKAFTTLNKSKQAQEFEELLQQNEQAFILQNQTLAEELGKLQMTVKTLENENRQFKRQISLAPQDKAKDAELRKLQAANVALKQSLEVLKQSKLEDVVDGSPDAPSESDVPSINGQVDGESVPQTEEKEIAPGAAISLNKNLIMKTERSESDADLQVQVLTLQEEKRLLEFELDKATKKHDAKVSEMTDAMVELQTKLDQKQKSCNSLQKDINELQTFKKEAITSAEKLSEENEKLRQDLVSSTSEVATLKNSLQEKNVILQQQNTSLTQWQQHVNIKDEEYKVLKSQNGQNLESLEKTSKELESSLASLELLQKEKDDLQSRYEKSASVGEALLNKHTDLERQTEKLEHELKQKQLMLEKQSNQLQDTKKYEMEIENLKKDLKDAMDLAEKRKRLADSQSVEAQEMVAKFHEQKAEIESSYEEKFNSLTEEKETKLKSLESTVKAHEEELIRAHHQERVKTREIDGLQQKINDLTAENTSLENSKGWFERALQDAETASKTMKTEHESDIEKLKEMHLEELNKAKKAVDAKDEEILTHQQQMQELKQEIEKNEQVIDNLKRDIKDEVQKQKLVEKKVHTTLKDLKKQLVSERKKNEVLQDKLKEQSVGKSNVEELLTVVDTSQQSSKPPSGGASSVSSFSFRDFISPGRSTIAGSASPVLHRAPTNPSSTNATHLTATETTDLLQRITELQNEKWALEEKVHHLEQSGGAMADELVEKTEMVQRYVQHTRTDTVKKHFEHSTPKSLRDKVKSFVTGNEESLQGGIGNVYELNKKLTRMLEEEMTKNIALKKDMELMSQQLGSR